MSSTDQNTYVFLLRTPLEIEAVNEKLSDALVGERISIRLQRLENVAGEPSTDQEELSRDLATFLRIARQHKSDIDMIPTLKDFERYVKRREDAVRREAEQDYANRLKHSIEHTTRVTTVQNIESLANGQYVKLVNLYDTMERELRNTTAGKEQKEA